MLLHIMPVTLKLYWFPVCQWIEFKLACLLLSAPVAGWTNIGVSGFQYSAYSWHWLPSDLVHLWEDMCRSTHTQQFWQQKFLCCWSSCVERLAIISATGHELQTFQAVTERAHV